jgi:hypothetical protein
MYILWGDSTCLSIRRGIWLEGGIHGTERRLTGMYVVTEGRCYCTTERGTNEIPFGERSGADAVGDATGLLLLLP